MSRGVEGLPRDEVLDGLLLRTSRTFALSIPVLPEPTRSEVRVAYLLFRVADTLEDATLWPPARKVEELERLAGLLREPSTETARATASRWLDDPPLRHEGYLELLGRLPLVLETLLSLPPPARELVSRHTLRTIERMGAFVSKERDGVLQLRDVEDLRAYCYAVAGIVGEMLTELFLLGREELSTVAPLLRRDAGTFGEALQLVNILKDAATDAREGRRYLPGRTEPGDILAMARRDLECAGRYSQRLHDAGAPRGVVEFTLLPIMLARATLDRVERQGPGAKLTRDEVREIVRTMNQALETGNLAGIRGR